MPREARPLGSVEGREGALRSVRGRENVHQNDRSRHAQESRSGRIGTWYSHLLEMMVRMFEGSGS